MANLASTYSNQCRWKEAKELRVRLLDTQRSQEDREEKEEEEDNQITNKEDDKEEEGD